MCEPIDRRRGMHAPAEEGAEQEEAMRQPRGPQHEAGRLRAGQASAPLEQAMVRGTVSDADRLRAIRERYARGMYDSPAVLDAVARRLLASGEL
ncbi:MAG TPA: hypothetical protein VF166_06555 [Gemmatimonadaceae bacterium]